MGIHGLSMDVHGDPQGATNEGREGWVVIILTFVIILFTCYNDCWKVLGQLGGAPPSIKGPFQQDFGLSC